MKKRAISSIFIMLAIVMAIASKFIVAEIFDVFIAVVGIVGALEMCNILEKQDIKVSKFLSSMFIVVLYASVIIAIDNSWNLLLLLGVALGAFVVYDLIIFVYEWLMGLKNKVERPAGQAFNIAINSIGVMIYPALFIALFFVINHIESFTTIMIDTPWLSLILIVFIWGIAIMSDTCAYIVGCSLRGPKLCPKISPNKTWSGAIGGLIGGALMGLILYFIIKNSNTLDVLLQVTNLNLIWFIMTGVLGSVFGQIGDIFESWLKRKANVKDSGNFIPGHGGMLDRVDALMFCLMFVGIVMLILV